MAGNSDRLQKLEAVRGLAAFYVFIHHYVHCNDELAFLQRFFVFGQTAVMVFFILSGFVIYYSSAGRNPDFRVRDYLIRRFRRIYPAFIVVMLMNWAIGCIAQDKWIDFEWKNFVGNLLMLQDKSHPNIWFEPYQNNHPLWSLSYEWWFYLLFLPVYFLWKARPQRQQVAAAVISWVGFASFILLPNQFSIIAAYFMMWWAGVEFAREYLDHGKVTWRRQALPVLVLGLNTLLWMGVAWFHQRDGGTLARSNYPLVQVQHQLTVFLMVVGAIAWQKMRFVGFDWTIGVFRHLSPISYVLYIIHLPLILFGGWLHLTGSVWLDILWLFPVIFGLSWLLEVPFQRAVNRVLK